VPSDFLFTGQVWQSVNGSSQGGSINLRVMLGDGFGFVAQQRHGDNIGYAMISQSTGRTMPQAMERHLACCPWRSPPLFLFGMGAFCYKPSQCKDVMEAI
jgi:hypothetical protein